MPQANSLIQPVKITVNVRNEQGQLPPWIIQERWWNFTGEWEGKPTNESKDRLLRNAGRDMRIAIFLDASLLTSLCLLAPNAIPEKRLKESHEELFILIQDTAREVVWKDNCARYGGVSTEVQVRLIQKLVEFAGVARADFEKKMAGFRKSNWERLKSCEKPEPKLVLMNPRGPILATLTLPDA